MKITEDLDTGPVMHQAKISINQNTDAKISIFRGENEYDLSYNKLVRLPFAYKHEKLYKRENTYDIILVLNYNMNPVKKNKGSAIFIHVAKNNFKKTEGCVAIKKINLVKLIKKINPNTKVKIYPRK